MGKRSERAYNVHGLRVTMRETHSGYMVCAKGQDLVVVTYTSASGHPCWSCTCGASQSANPATVLAHVVGSHSELSQRPRSLITTAGVGMVGEASSVAMTTYLRLVGLHPDPTAEQAIRNISARL